MNKLLLSLILLLTLASCIRIVRVRDGDGKQVCELKTLNTGCNYAAILDENGKPIIYSIEMKFKEQTVVQRLLEVISGLSDKASDAVVGRASRDEHDETTSVTVEK